MGGSSGAGGGRLKLYFSVFLSLAVSAFAQAPSDAYWVYVAAESADEVSLLRFAPEGLTVSKTIPVGSRPTEMEGPHGLRVSPDGAFWYVSLAHGNPFGFVHKFETGSDRWVGATEVGMFPATLDVAASTGLLYVANFDLHGGMVPGSISVVETESMLEVARLEVGVMPHGSRLNEAEDRLYAVTMMSGELVETNAWTFEVTRRLSLGGHAMPGMEGASPTWVEPAPNGRLWVAVGGAGEIREVDPAGWEVVRTLEAPGAYNVGVSPDGRWLVATYRSEGSIGIFALDDGRETARIPSSRDLPHGIAISPDSRYAFVSIEGVGGEPGAVDVVDLAAGERVDTVDVGKQASGIAFWKMEAR